MTFLYSGRLDLGEFVKKEISKAMQMSNEGSSNSDINTSTDRPHRTGLTYTNMAVDYLIDFLRVADEYLLEELKNICQNEIIEIIDQDTYQLISEMGELYNADRIVEYCQWFKRREISKIYGSRSSSTFGDFSVQSYVASRAPANSMLNDGQSTPGVQLPTKSTKAVAGSTNGAKVSSSNSNNTGSSGGRNSLSSVLPQRSKHS